MSAASVAQQVIVVGGGLGGLLVGAELKRRGIEALVLEAGDRPGGVARTIREDGYLLEPAAGSVLLPNPHLTPILDAAGVSLVSAKPEARTRFVYDRGILHEVPESPKFLLTGLVSWRAKFRAAREPWISTPPPPGEESLLDFHTRRFGHDVGQIGAELMAHGVFAGDPSLLSVQAAFPKMTALEAETGSVVRSALRRRKSRPKGGPRATVYVAPNGMAEVAAQLAHYLGDRYRTDSPVQSVVRNGDRWTVEWAGGIESASNVVLALSPTQAAPLLTGPLVSLLSGRQAAPVAVVGLGGPASALGLPNGFGALAGAHSGIRALGILFESAYAPGRAPEGHQLAKGLYGGGADPGIMDKTDDQIAALMCGELGRIVGRTADPSWVRVARTSIPQYPIGHVDWLGRVDEQLSALGGLHLAGWGYRGVGISSLGADAARIGACVEASRR